MGRKSTSLTKSGPTSAVVSHMGPFPSRQVRLNIEAPENIPAVCLVGKDDAETTQGVFGPRNWIIRLPIGE